MSRVMVDRRRFPRKDASVCTWLSFHKDVATYATLSVDLSRDGAAFSSAHQVNLGDHVSMEMQLDANHVDCKGEICWIQSRPGGQKGFGVRFIDMERSQGMWIDDYLESMDSIALPTHT